MKHIKDYLERYAETVITRHTDQRHGTPLFHDGADSFDGSPVVWKNPDGSEWEISNLASQQNLFRFLSALTALTGNTSYTEAAKKAIRWNFAHADPGGLLIWGGHAFYDLKTLSAAGPAEKKMMHELKDHFSFYELMYETDPEATSRLINAIWTGHMIDWDTVEMSRHGVYGKPEERNVFSRHPMNTDLELFRPAKGLSFINIGSDLIFAALMLSHLERDKAAFEWAEFLSLQYVRSRHPVTKLGVYQYTVPEKRTEPPEDESDPKFTWSFFGDRAARQFCPEFGEIALEANVLFSTVDELLSRPEKIYGSDSAAITSLLPLFGIAGNRLLDWTVEGLAAWAAHAFVPGTREFKPMFTDGKDLTGQKFSRYGFYGNKGDVFEHGTISPLVFLSYVSAWRASGREELIPVICGLTEQFGLGRWNVKDPGHEIKGKISADDPLLVFALLDMYKATGSSVYLDAAKTAGGNLFVRTSHRGYFVPGEKFRYCRFDDVTPFALASLLAVLEGKGNSVPAFRGTGGAIHGDMLMDDGSVRTIYDVRDIYSGTV